MAHKRAVRKQQDSSHPAAKAVAANSALDPLAHLRSLADAFNAAVAQSVVDGDPVAVHRLRTGSRRLQAMVEATRREAGPEADGLERPARAYLRLLKQTRRACGTVRDLDVQRKLLENWIAKLPATHSSEPSTPERPSNHDGGPSPLRIQAEALDAWLRSERKQLGHGLQKEIKKRQQGLTERQGVLFAAIAREPLGRTTALRPADTVALEAFVRAADATPTLDAENLHDFRKATKKARYVAESGAVDQRYSRVAEALKRIQDAIGDWHDWLCLAEDAKEALGPDAPELTAALRREVARHFAAAMRTTQSVRGRLLGEWMATPPGKAISEPPAKRPSTPVEIGAHRIAANRQSA
jgi:CHAD domain-containing protein